MQEDLLKGAKRGDVVGDRRNYWGIAAFVCCILALVFIPFLIFIILDSGGVDMLRFRIFSIPFLLLGITATVLALIAISKRGCEGANAVVKKRSSPWLIAAFICCVLSILISLFLYFRLFEGWFTSIAKVGDVDIISAFIALSVFWGTIGIILAIIASIKRRVRGKTLAVVPIVVGILEVQFGSFGLSFLWVFFGTW